MKQLSIVALATLIAACGGKAAPPRVVPTTVVVDRNDWTIEYRLVMEPSPQLEAKATVTNRTQYVWAKAFVVLSTRGGHEDPDAAGVAPDLDTDSDRDRRLDVDDKCPNEPESYNGVDDDDGCPDRGPVPPQGGGDYIIEYVYFTPNSAELRAASLPVLDAIAATIVGNPQLELVEVGGHTDATEREPWDLSARRAAAVIAHVVSKGVARNRLSLAPYASTQPTDRGKTTQAKARNRRTSFTIVRAANQAPPMEQAPLPVLVPRRAAAESLEDVRFTVAEQVSLAPGETATVPLFTLPVQATRELLYAPTTDVVGSAAHPLHAVHLVNTASHVFPRGPVELVGGGRGELERTSPGADTWLLGGIDESTTVTVTARFDPRPRKILMVRGQALDVEDDSVLVTTYASQVPVTVVHPKSPGRAVDALPPDTVTGPTYFRTKLAGAPLTFAETQPRTRRIVLTDLTGEQLMQYVNGSTLPAGAAQALAAAARVLTTLADAEARLAQLRTQLGMLMAPYQPGGPPIDRDTRAKLATLGRDITVAAATVAAARTDLDVLVHDLVYAP